MSMPNERVPNYKKDKKTKDLKGKIDNTTVTVACFKTLLTAMDRLSREKIMRNH